MASCETATCASNSMRCGHLSHWLGRRHLEEISTADELHKNVGPDSGVCFGRTLNWAENSTIIELVAC